VHGDIFDGSIAVEHGAKLLGLVIQNSGSANKRSSRCQKRHSQRANGQTELIWLALFFLLSLSHISSILFENKVQTPVWRLVSIFKLND
jgi:hypothetical protein